MVLKFPVYIPSKGRSRACKTARLLQGALPFSLVVEPGEAEEYRGAFPLVNLITLPGNDRGLPFARNFILDHARGSGLDWFWMLDDDITGFYKVVAGKCVPAPGDSVLNEATALLRKAETVAQAGLEYQQFAWSARGQRAVNSYCDVAVAIHAGRLGRIRYREDVVLKEDRDLTLQVLAAGWNTMRFSRLAFACPKNGSNAGGLAPFYASPGREESASRRMCELWGPQVCKFHRKPDGRPDVKINWKFFQQVMPRR